MTPQPASMEMFAASMAFTGSGSVKLGLHHPYTAHTHTIVLELFAAALGLEFDLQYDKLQLSAN